MTGDIGSSAGATTRPIERAVRPISPPACIGSRIVASAAFAADPGRRRATPSIRRDEWTIDSRISERVSIDSGAGAPGVSSGSAASAVRSTSSASSAMPPTPSVTEWCTFIANAARSVPSAS